MQSIDREISDKYGFEVKSIVPYKDSFLLITPRGKKLLKKIPFSAERIEFIHGAKEHLADNGFSNTDRYVCTLDGQAYFVFENSNYCISDMIEGRECNFDNDSDLCGGAVLLGRMHKCSRGYVPSEGCKIQSDLGKLPASFSKRLEDIRKLKKLAKRGSSGIDHMFLEYADHFYQVGEDALNKLQNTKYSLLVEEAGSNAQLCHHDVTHHNIICSSEEIYFINFDYCCFELKVYDVANFIRRKMRKCRWDIREVDKILNNYCSAEPLSQDELQVMKVILQFPQKFWRVSNKFYNSRRSWSEKGFMSKLQEVIDEIPDHMRFMEKLDKLI